MSADWPWFADDEALATLEGQAREAPGSMLTLELAWQLRQRNPKQAAKLAEALASQPLAPLEAARLCLLNAELAYVSDDLVAADAQARAAYERFEQLGCAAGCVDALLLLANAAHERGDRPAQEAALAAMQAPARDDAQRRYLAVFSQARLLAGADLGRGDALVAEALNTSAAPPLAPAQAHLSHYRAFACAMRGSFAQSIPNSVAAFQASLETGQLCLAVRAACNASYGFNNLGEVHSALEWAQLAHEQARRMDRQSSACAAMMVEADALRRLQRWDEAEALLQRCMQLLDARPDSHARAVTLVRVGHLHQDLGRHAQAYDCFTELLRHARTSRSSELLEISQIGLAQSALAMGRHEEARQHAQAVTDSASTDASRRITALQLLAQLAKASHAEAALPLLEQALRLAGELPDSPIPSTLLEDLAQEHAARGHFEQALQFARQSNVARKALYALSSGHRALAARVQRETRRLQDEAEQQGRQAEEQDKRSASLRQANQTLERLGAMGRDIVARLDAQDVCTGLLHHAQDLLDVDCFIVYRMHARERQLVCLFGQDAGQPLHRIRLDLDSPSAWPSRCARERRQLLADTAIAPAGARPMLSSIFTPLLLNGQLLGVLSLQSLRDQAYGEHELAMARSLAAFAAIGLSNAYSLEQLRQAQFQAAQQDKLANLGELVASLGQEIQLPLAVINSGGREMSECLDQLLALLPTLLQQLQPEAQGLLAGLFGRLGTPPTPLDHGDERAQRRQLAQTLQLAGIADARPLADALLPLGGTAVMAQLLPLLRHPQREGILQLIRLLASLLGNTGQVNAAAERAARVVHALKNYARGEESRGLQSVDLRDSLDTVLTLHQHRFRDGIELCCRFGTLPPMQAHAGELYRLWSLLLDAAMQGIRTPGRLEWTLTQEGMSARLTVSSSAAGSHLELPEAAQKITARHGGNIHVERTITQGRKFTVRLPYNRENT